jgi:hypothetical protein
MVHVICLQRWHHNISYTVWYNNSCWTAGGGALPCFLRLVRLSSEPMQFFWSHPMKTTGCHSFCDLFIFFGGYQPWSQTNFPERKEVKSGLSIYSFRQTQFWQLGERGGNPPPLQNCSRVSCEIGSACISESATQKFYNVIKTMPFSETARGMSANQRNEICLEANG